MVNERESDEEMSQTITIQYFSSSVALILYYAFLKSCLRFSFLLDHKLANQLSVALLPCYSPLKQLLPFLLALLEKQIKFLPHSFW